MNHEQKPSFPRRQESSRTAAPIAQNWIPACAGMTLLLWAATAQATPLNARLYKQQYGVMPSCNACHSSGGGSVLDAYGDSFKKAGMNAAAFTKIAKLDADGDGFDNATEGTAKSNPADKKSTPKAPGDWLSTVALIPKEVQALFPGVREYLPRDAVLTDADIARAKVLGAVLSKADENTIYVPLADKRPAGTALIFAAEFKGKSFFLLMTTDRQLTVTRVQPLNTDKVPEAGKSKVFGQFTGLAVDKLPATGGAGVDAAITAAVKKAGTLLFVRLKNA